MASEWKPTNQMAEYFAISTYTLKQRWGGPDGFLKQGTHWRIGPHRNSKRWWNVETCTAEAKERGFLFPGAFGEEQG